MGLSARSRAKDAGPTQEAQEDSADMSGITDADAEREAQQAALIEQEQREKDAGQNGAPVGAGANPVRGSWSEESELMVQVSKSNGYNTVAYAIRTKITLTGGKNEDRVAARKKAALRLEDEAMQTIAQMEKHPDVMNMLGG